MFYWVVKAILTPLLRVLYRPWTEGLENIPETGPAIIASNHLSFLDSIFMPLMVPRRVTFLAKSDYFTEPGVKGLLKRMFFTGVGQVPIDRSGGRASQAALSPASTSCARASCWASIPEGTRSPDGRLYRGKVGVARMALEAGVPVIPVAMIGTFEVQPQGKVIPRVKRVGMRFGAPLDFSRYAGLEDDRFVLAEHDRRDHVRAHVAVEPGVRRHLRGQGEGRSAAARKPGPPPPTPSPPQPPEDADPEPTREAA